jgi:acyl-CoA synthetase (NDP forming)
MRQFFYPSDIAVFGVTNSPENLAKNIILNCQEAGFRGNIYPVGKKSGEVYGSKIITNPELVPQGVDLAVILVPANGVSEIMKVCGEKGIRHVIISSAGFREFNDEDSPAERDVQAVAKQYGIRFIGPNCIGVMCTHSGLRTPFNPMKPQLFKKGSISLISQSGGVATQSAYVFSEEHVGVSKIISAGNKLDINEIDLLQYLMNDEDTEQIHLYLESIEDGRALMKCAKQSRKPIVLFKSNTGKTASVVAKSHTAALSNNDKIVDCAVKQAGIIRVEDIHSMTVCAKALKLPPLGGDRLVAISISGGFAVTLGDLCEKYGFVCPELPRQLLDRIESKRRGGIIRISNPMDFGDIYSPETVLETLEDCLALDSIDGVVLSYMYSEEMSLMFQTKIGGAEQVLGRIEDICRRTAKPVALSLFAERHYTEEFKKTGIFPVFNNQEESVRALRVLRNYWQGREEED